jgi:hypothetical protein
VLVLLSVLPVVRPLIAANPDWKTAVAVWQFCGELICVAISGEIVIDYGPLIEQDALVAKVREPAEKAGRRVTG